MASWEAPYALSISAINFRAFWSGIGSALNDVAEDQSDLGGRKSGKTKGFASDAAPVALQILFKVFIYISTREAPGGGCPIKGFLVSSDI